MELKMQPGLPQFLRDENGHLPTWMRPTLGLSSSHEKPLGRRGSQPDSSRERLLQYADIFTAAATYKLKLGRDGAEKTIWLQREDLSNTSWRLMRLRIVRRADALKKFLAAALRSRKAA